MKVIAIGIRSREKVMKDFEDAFEAARKRLPFKPRTGVYFTSLEAARNFLTPKRMELLHLIREKHPHSIYALAKHAVRSFPSVLRDVELLARHGLVTLTKEKESPRQSIRPRVGYDAINLWIGV